MIGAARARAMQALDTSAFPAESTLREGGYPHHRASAGAGCKMDRVRYAPWRIARGREVGKVTTLRSEAKPLVAQICVAHQVAFPAINAVAGKVLQPGY
jgi:hypothetical protein